MKNMNESLEANKDPLNRQVLEAQQEMSESRRMVQECLPPLQDKVTQLMLQLENEMSEQEESKKPSSR